MSRTPLPINQHTCVCLHLNPEDFVHASVCVCVSCGSANRFRSTMCAAPFQNFGNSLLTLSSPPFPKHARPFNLLSFSFYQTHITHTPLCCSAPSHGLLHPPRRLSSYSVTLAMGRACTTGPCKLALSAGQLSQDLRSVYIAHICAEILCQDLFYLSFAAKCFLHTNILIHGSVSNRVLLFAGSSSHLQYKYNCMIQSLLL